MSDLRVPAWTTDSIGAEVASDDPCWPVAAIDAALFGIAKYLGAEPASRASAHWMAAILNVRAAIVNVRAAIVNVRAAMLVDQAECS